MIRVLVVDDHPLVRAGLVGLLAGTRDIEVVGEATGGEQALALADELRPDVVLMDLSMPGISGDEATKLLRDRLPEARVVVLTSFQDSESVRRALQAGAVGFVLKDSEPDEIIAAVRSAAAGAVPIDPRVAGTLLPSAPPAVTGREADVLRRLALGLSNKQIAAELGIAERTVKVHVGSLFRRIGVADRTSAALWARDNGY